MTAVVEGSVALVSRSVSEVLAAGVQPGSVVCAALSDGLVAGWLVVEDQVTVGTERRCAVVGVAQCVVVSAGTLSEVKVSGDPVPTQDVMPEWATALAGAFWAAQRARAETAAVRSALTAHQTRLESIVDAAHEYANDNDLCSRFDSFMEDNGLRPRSKEWVCVVDATVRVRISVTARDPDAAEGMVTDEMVTDAIADLRGRLLDDSVQQHDVSEVEEA